MSDLHTLYDEAEKLKDDADSVMEVATGVGGVGGLVGELPPSPHAASKSTTESRI